jgi:anaerobic magnesium-protoporphyrin IX monomethyl ester cyclase
MDKILIVAPPRDFHMEYDIMELSQNLSIWNLASYLKMNNIDVDIFDMINVAHSYRQTQMTSIIRVGFSVSILEEEIKRTSPKIIGINCLSSCQHQVVLDLAKTIKSIKPDSFIIVGGNHATFMSREIIKDGNGSIDFVATGESEDVLTEFCRLIFSGKIYEAGLVEGILSWENYEGRQRSRKPLLSPEKLPILLPELYERTRKLANASKNRSIDKSCEVMLSRGCVFNCDFCTSGNMWKRKLRVMPYENIDKQFALIKEYGYEHLLIEDDDISSLMKHINMSELINKYDFTWQDNGGINLDTITEEQIMTMSKSNCLSVSAPINLRSIAEDTLDNSKKQRIEKSLSYLNQYKIDAVSFLIFGMPNQRRSELEAQIEYGRYLKQKYNLKYIFILAFSVLPGTTWREKLGEFPGTQYAFGEKWWPGYSLYTPQLNTQHISALELGKLLKKGMEYINGPDYNQFFKPLLVKNSINEMSSNE